MGCAAKGTSTCHPPRFTFANSPSTLLAMEGPRSFGNRKDSRAIGKMKTSDKARSSYHEGVVGPRAADQLKKRACMSLLPQKK